MVEDSTASRGLALRFDPVWLILKRPRPNFDPPSFMAPGALSVDGQRATFGPSGARLYSASAERPNTHLTMDRVVGVRRKRYGWGVVPRLVEITYESTDVAAIAYFNDGTWKGWRPLLTGSNRRIVKAIRQHLGTSQIGPVPSSLGDPG
jgi:hypothetical protein